MRSFRVHVVYEHGGDNRPYSSSHIRLLRPLTHPALSPWLEVSSAPELCDDPVDAVIVDRLWHDEISGEKAQALVDDVRRRRARLIYSLDDNLVELLSRSEDAEAGRKLAGLQVFLGAADRVIVSTWPLHDAIRQFNPRISVIPNYLDERLLPYGALGTQAAHKRGLASRRQSLRGPVTLGYMGTRTHDEDLRMILPVLWRVWSRHPGRLRIEFVGAVARDETWRLLEGLPVERVDPGLVYTEYPSFLPWFAGTRTWDVALAPLTDSVFNNCKSDVKFLDYAALGAAGVFSRVPAYEHTVQHGVTGFVVENSYAAWEDVLEHLIQHPVEALSVGWAAQRYLRHHRTLAQGCELWLNAVHLTMTQGE